MKAAEDLALRFATLVSQEREAESRLAKIRAEKEDALKKLLAIKTNGSGSSSPQGSGDKERVYQLLEAQPNRVFSTGEVATTLHMAGNVASVYLSELFNKDARIARIAKGQYQSMKSAPRAAWPVRREVEEALK